MLALNSVQLIYYRFARGTDTQSFIYHTFNDNKNNHDNENNDNNSNRPI